VEAVRAAQQLQPDLILLDIGLPVLNGIAAARQIREVSPKSKVLYVSENRSPWVAEEALRVGAHGYVLKSKGASELLRGIRAVLRGQRFVSASVRGFDPASFLMESGSEPGEVPKLAGAVPPLGAPVRNRHEVEFYCDDEVLVADVTRFIGTALQAGDAGLVLATEPHREDLLRSLHTFGVNVSAAIEEGRYIAVDAAMSQAGDERFDAGRLVPVLSDLITTAAKGATTEHPRVMVFGEISDVLLAEGNAEMAMQDGRLCEQLMEMHAVDILCGYSLSGFQGESDACLFQQICAQHAAIHLAH